MQLAVSMRDDIKSQFQHELNHVRRNVCNCNGIVSHQDHFRTPDGQ